MYIGIDLGGTNIAVGLVDKNGKIVMKASCPTQRERDWKEIVRDMAKLSKQVTEKAGYSLDRIKAVGIGSPGTIDSKNGVVVYANNLKMENAPVADEFRKYIDVPVHMENDANAAAFGEYVANGEKCDSYIFMTLGTGVGGGIVINGKIYRGFNYAGAEIGHTVICVDGEACSCGRKGCLEAYASVTALINQTKEKMKACPESIMHKWVRENGAVNGRCAFECAQLGDKAATEVRDRYIEYVAVGIANMINIFQPEMFVIGGGISREGDVILNPVREFLKTNDYNRFMPKTEIKIASLFNDAGIVGAAMAAMEE